MDAFTSHSFRDETTPIEMNGAANRKPSACITVVTGVLPDLPSLLFQENPKQSKKTSVSEIIIIATEALADLFRPGFCTERDKSSKIIRISVSHLHLFQHYFTQFSFNPFKTQL